MALLLCCGIGARAGNVVTIGSASGVPGDEVTVSIALANTDAVAAMQVTIPLPAELSYVEGSAALTDRASSHSVSAGVKDGELSIMVFSMSLTPFSGSEGPVLTLRLALGNTPQDFALEPSRTVLTDTEGNLLSEQTTGGTVSIRCAKAEYSSRELDFGSVPIRATYHSSIRVTNTGNEPLTVTALQFTTLPTAFSSSTPLPLTVEAGASADVDVTYAPTVRGAVTETVRVVCNSVSKLNSITLKAQPYAVNEWHMTAAEGIADEVVTVGMTMNNMDDISGFQLEFDLPQQLTYVAGSFALTDRRTDHTLVESLSGSRLRILCYSPTDSPFSANDGQIATMQLRLSGRYTTTLEPALCVLSSTIDGQATDVCSASYGAQVTIQSPVISASSSLDMGHTPVTAAASGQLYVYNYGNAPLTISRVVFGSDGFSLAETLPLTIAASSGEKLTVCYPSTTEGEYATTMSLHTNDPDQRLHTVQIAGSRFAPNYLDVAVADVCSGDDVTVRLGMSNYDAVSAMQFDLTYPADYFTLGSDISTTARASGYSMTTRELSAGTARCFIYSLSGSIIAPSEGTVLSLKLLSRGTAPEGTYSLQLSNIQLGTPDMTDKYAGTDLSTSFSVRALLLGDVNGDGEITAQDASLIQQYVTRKIGDQTEGFYLRAADVNADGEVTAQDASLVRQYVVRKINW